ncbi:hypothetical protein H4K36_35110 [Streptomyces sp. DHE7-1]|nr:hypothetical protein [Streptomyces sp. DHE7-1]
MPSSRVRPLAVLSLVTALALSACSGPAAPSKKVTGAGAAATRAAGTESPAASGGGRSSVTFRGTSALSTGVLRDTAERMRRRATAQGLTGVRIDTRSDSVVVTGPAAETDRMRALGSTGLLHFRPVLAMEGPGGPQPTDTPRPRQGRAATEGLRADPTASPSAGVVPGTDASGALDAALQRRFTALDCSRPGQRPDGTDGGAPRDPVVACAAAGDTTARGTKYVLAPAALDGADVDAAKAVRDTQTGSWQVRLSFTVKGAAKLADLTGRLALNQAPRNEFAVVLDGAVLTAPSVGQRLTGGEAVISGSFDRRSAAQLAALVTSGALPAPLSVAEVTTVPAA